MRILKVLHIFVISLTFETALSQEDVFDKYDDRMLWLKNGSRIELHCEHISVAPKKCEDFSSLQILAPDDTVVADEPLICDPEDPPETPIIVYNLTVNENFPFGNYKCRIGESVVSHGNMRIDYVLCDDQSEMCQNGPTCADKDTFCFVHKGDSAGERKLAQCSKMPSKDLCILHRGLGGTVCPIHVDSVCHAIITDYSQAWSYYNDVRCPSNGERGTLRLTYPQAEIRPLYEPIEITKDAREFTIGYEENADLDGADFLCVIKDAKAEQVWNQTGKMTKSVQFQLIDQVFQTGPAIYKVECKLYTTRVRTQPGVLHSAQVAAILVYLGGIAEITQTPGSPELECELKHPNALEFKFDYWWIRKSDSKRDEGKKLIITKTDEYECHIRIKYRTCSPFREFMKEVKSGYRAITADISITTSSTSTTTTSMSTTLSAIDATSTTSSMSTSLSTTTSSFGSMSTSSTSGGVSPTNPIASASTKPVAPAPNTTLSSAIRFSYNKNEPLVLQYKTFGLVAIYWLILKGVGCDLV